MTCLKLLRLLNEPLKKIMRCFYYLEALILFSPWCLYLGWLGACWQHVWLIQSHHKPLWSFSFWLLMPFYASLNDVLSLCTIMAVIALLVGCPSLLLALILYWVWALLVHPTPKNQVIPMCPSYIPISNLLFQSTFDLLLSILQMKLFWCYVKISQ
jgi:hypothetical protein